MSGTGQTTALAAFDALKQPASDTYAGVSEHATAAEFLTGTSTTLIPPVSVIRNGIINLGTPVASTSGTSIDFTGIPSWAKEITINLAGVSLSGTSGLRFQLGTSSGPETSGYLGATSQLTSVVATTNPTAGFDSTASTAASLHHGFITFRLLSSAANIWCANGGIALSDAGRAMVIFGSKTLALPLDRVRITTLNGTDTFDAGTVNVSYS